MENQMYLKTARIAEMDGLAVNASTPEMIEASAAGRTGCTAGNAAVKCFTPLSAHPWLAPDDEEWFPPFRPVRCPYLGSGIARHRRTCLAAMLYCETLRTAPFGKSSLWTLGYAPWEF